MPRRKGLIERNTFVRGLITEATPLTFPENASILEENFELNRDGSRSRRLGLDYEGSYAANEIITANEIEDAQINTFEWFDAGTAENRNFIIVQIGSILHFYDIEASNILSNNKKAWTLDLVDYSVNSNITNSQIEVAFTSFDVIRGLLVVTNSRCTPIYIAYDNETDLFAAGIITVSTRDLLGIDDGFDITYRPPVAQYGAWRTITHFGIFEDRAISRTNPEIMPHWYNLYNQGWDLRGIHMCHRDIIHKTEDLLAGDGLPSEEWDGFTLTGTNQAWPSNIDIMHIGKAGFATGGMTSGEVGRFFPNFLYKQKFGSTLAPRGSNIINSLRVIRSFYSQNSPESQDEEPPMTANLRMERSGIKTGTMSYNVSQQTISFQADGAISSGGTAPAITPRTDTPIKLKGVRATVSYNIGTTTFVKELPEELLSFLNTDIIPIATPTISGGVITYHINWNLSAFLEYGVDLNSVTLTYDKAQVYYYTANRHEIIEDNTEEHGYTATASYAGRAWYTGLTTGQFQNYVFYSQTIRGHVDLGKCYSEGDPTSEFNSDIIDTDGGFIVIPEADRIINMTPMGRNLFVFATNGVWRISGGQDNFIATSHSVDKISGVGVESPQSIVPVENTIAFWSSGGIYLVSPSEVTGDYELRNISEETVQTDYLNISTLAKQHVKGVYDQTTKKITWLVNENPSYPSSGGVENTNKYDTLYSFETVLGSFFKHKIATDAVNTLPFIADIVQLPSTTEVGVLQNVYSNGELVTSNGEQVVSTVTLPRDTLTQTKVFVVSKNTGGTPFVTFAEFNNTSFLDWFEHDSTGTDYLSHLITGYELGESISRKKQAQYLHMFFKRTETVFEDSGGNVTTDNPSSCLVTALWDFATDKDSWPSSSQFQAYRIPRLYISGGSIYDYGQDVIVSKSKIRGKGRALSLDIRSETGKDCHIYGWGIPIVRQERI